MLEHQEKIIRDQEITIKSHEKYNADLKLRLEVLENEMRKHEILSNAKEVTNDSGKNQRADYVEENAINSVLDHKDMTATDNIKITTFNLNRIIKRQSNGIAFHAYMTGSKCVSYQQVIVFDTEVIDEGNGYSPTDGIYVVPETGTYVFMWTIFSPIDEWSVIDLVVDGSPIGWITTDAENNQATGIAIVHVNTGIHVFIRRSKSSSGCTIHDHLARPTFTGWKLF
ncbi:uncharacterized protein LOC132756095 [Ruditapes philippinarum]|uniref:uncharacterized protein LOC132756095 n=1 Tax=Ruditapes philippinarum TaxID=129788 RepID=UPI00295ADCAD|nr:uncharacterized protein LOC132756095 [Ruditapes philippinarum]